MTKLSQQNSDKGATLDLVAVTFLLLVNPISLCFGCDLRFQSPDSVYYTYIAEQFTLLKPDMALTGVGHIDAGLFYPILFPALMASLSPLMADLYQSAALVSRLSALCLLFPAYFLLRTLANRPVALFTCLLIPVSAEYFYTAMSPLSESLFMLMSVFLAWYSLIWLKGFQHWTTRQRILYSFLFGSIASLSFFSRQIGAFAIPYVLLLIGMSCFSNSWKKSGRLLLSSFCVCLATMILIVGGYLLLSWHQTGLLPTKQHFRINQYVVTTNNQEIIETIQSIKQHNRERTQTSDLIQRRDLRALTPDASEMYSYVITDGTKNSMSTAWKNRAKKFSQNLKTNLVHLRNVFGEINFLLLCFSMVSPFLFRFADLPWMQRYFIPLMLFSYISLLSLVSSYLDRYVIVLLPLITLHVASELHLGYRWLGERHSWAGKPQIALLLLTMGVTGHAASLPELFTDVTVHPEKAQWHTHFESIRDEVAKQPVFSFDPYTAWLAGGIYRKLPNDSLDKVARYARLTGVRWIIIEQSERAAERHFYRGISDWYKPGRIDSEYPNLLRYCCEALTETGQGYRVYEILDSDFSTDTDDKTEKD